MIRLRAMVRSAAVLLFLAACLPLGAQNATVSISENERNLIESYYQTILGREADAGGIAYWGNESAVTRSLGGEAAEAWRAMAVAFFASPEYASRNPADGEFLDDLYAAFLSRPADAEGQAYWAGVLQGGVARDAVLIAFLFSPEFNARMQALFGAEEGRAEVAMVVDFYRGFLNRLPDVDGFRYWRTRFRAAQCTSGEAVSAEAEAISSQFVGSAEYAQRARSNAQFVADLYNAFLRRGGELEGFRFWTAELDSGRRTREQVRAAFGRAPEFLNRVASIVSQGCAKLADESDLRGEVSSSPSPFIAIVDLQGAHADRITGASFVVAPRPGTMSRPVRARYSNAALLGRTYGPVAAGTYRLPVFGLYEGYTNDVSLEIAFDDGSTRRVSLAIASGPWIDSTGYYKNVTVLKARAADAILDYDFFYIRSIATQPLVMDTDGYVRWWAPVLFGSASTLYDGGDFFIGDPNLPLMLRVGLDGSEAQAIIAGPYTNFHHNIEPGKDGGILLQLDGLYEDGVTEKIEVMIVEVDRAGNTLKTWDLAAIFSQHMAAAGDDPSLFVLPGVDWLHTNAVTYDRRDDSLIISGRETFVVKIDYATGAIRWILGDPTKYWYTFSSLRDRALTLEGGGVYPIGQHATSVTRDGLVMVFNNGRGSLNNPPGTPAGAELGVSSASAYAIDEVARTAREVLHLEHQGLKSNFCSSVYEEGDSLLFSFAQANAGANARVVGYDFALAPVFDFQLPNLGCAASYNARPLPFHDLVFE